MTEDRGTQSATPGPVILIVDDEPDVLESLGRLLGQGIRKARLLKARDGSEALALLDQGSVDMIISDYKMPAMDGVELLHWASRTHPETRRVMLTAFADDEAVQQALAEAFVDRLIPKTMPPGELIAHLVDVLQTPRARRATATV